MITSVQNETVKRFSKLHQKKYRDKEALFIVEGKHLVEEASKAGLLHTVFTLEEGEGTIQVSEAVMRKLTQTDHVPPVAAVVKKPSEKPLTDRVLLLENVQDPGNVGTLIRTALAFGFETVILDRSADIYAPKVQRSTQGAIFQMAIRTMDARTFKTHYPTYTLIATDLEGTPDAPRIAPPLALILGNEGQGLKRETLKLADHRLKIPVQNIDSLNVAVAGGILMHKLS
ncbi:MAG: TrmH family RNA methyltransferase [Bacillota bacterium]